MRNILVILCPSFKGRFISGSWGESWATLTGLKSSGTGGVWLKSLEDDCAAQVRERSLLGLLGSPGRDSRIWDNFRIVESDNVKETGALYKISKFLIFKSKTAKEKLENTSILSHFGDYELILTATRSSQKWEGAYFCYTFPSWIHKWPSSRL